MMVPATEKKVEVFLIVLSQVYTVCNQSTVLKEHTV